MMIVIYIFFPPGMFTCIAVSLFNTLASIATPCSVKAKGKYLLCSPLFKFFKDAICDLKESYS